MAAQRLKKTLTAHMLICEVWTYLIAGGLGSLGVEVAEFLVEKGARRVILVSRRALPPRSEWAFISETSPSLANAVQRIQQLVKQGATICALAIDISSPTAVAQLSEALEALSFPPVSGVVHVAGVLDDEIVLSTTPEAIERVLAPKVSGTLTLCTLFPPKTLDFLILFSSAGQIFGTPGQALYASANAFLDALAVQRRAQGDNAVSIQWTRWCDMGKLDYNDFISAELVCKGVTDISRGEAFRAWTHISTYDVGQAVVIRSRVFEPEEPLPNMILADIALRRKANSPSTPTAAQAGQPAQSAGDMPSSPAEREAYLENLVRECVANVLKMDSSGVTSKEALINIGLDSVMSVHLRGQLQKRLRVQIPATFTWTHPTVEHIVKWLMEKIGSKAAR
ncbi:hypothetical protein AJ79_09561 [Helicocarpus griseus UAMH5409]|uniref:Carrier domain-containing protein n=1 Tax=Helicocarpus griseus UAMH5409 TaxID=1447875 RepID=A0A2B7WJ07_9EURO|nr:hypothetical protein AJ79_09561 [Helicocarpus griseus UAMH5409]